MLKVKEMIFILVTIFLVSCTSLSVDEIKKNTIDSKEENSNVIKGKDIGLLKGSEESIKIATSEEIKAFSENSKFVFFLKPGDKINVKATGMIEDSEILIVRPDGKINVKKIGTIEAENKTPEDIEKILNEEIKKYYTNTKYIVEVLEYNNNKVYIWGDIKAPGVYKFGGRTTLVEAITQAGGLVLNMEDSETKQNKTLLFYCCVVRKNNPPIWIKLNSIISEGEILNNVALLPEDILYIYKRKI